MMLNLKKIFSAPGTNLSLNGIMKPEEYGYITGISFSMPPEISANAENRAGIITLRFNVSFSLNLTCDRCLKEFQRDFSYDFEHPVVNTLHSEDNGEYIVADNDSVNLGEIALSDLIAQLPSKTLCRVDCLGLCPECGCDLNESACDCHAESAF